MGNDGSVVVDMIYELLNDPEYIDFYCVDLSPHPVDRTIEEQDTLWNIRRYALRNFDACFIGYRLFFKTDTERQQFLTWMILKWA